MGYTDADGIRDNIFPSLGIDIPKINTCRAAHFTFNVCNFTDKRIESIPHDKTTEDHLIAGVSLPIVMPALQLDEKWYTDAVWIKDANLTEAVQRGSNKLWLVWAIGNTSTYLPGALNQYVHMIEMSANGGLLEEYARISMLNNKNGTQQKSAKKQNKPIRLFVIKPEYPLPLDTDLYLGKTDTRTLINMGYECTKNCLKSMPAKGIAMDEQATKMKSPGIRLNCHNTFIGMLMHDEHPLSATYYQHIVIHQQNEDKEVKIYSSISLEDFEHEVPCFDHQATLGKSKHYTVLNVSCKFLYEGQAYNITSRQVIHSSADFLLGLGFKALHITISKDVTQEFHGTLYQSIGTRLRNIFKNNLRKEDGTGGGLIQKYKYFKNLLHHDI